MRQALWHREVNWQDHYQKSIKGLIEEIGKEPDLDLINDLYSPEILHEKIPGDDDKYNVFRIRVEGVTVRYVEDWYDVQVTVEGNLPEGLIEIIKSDLLKKFSRLENSECYIEMI